MGKIRKWQEIAVSQLKPYANNARIHTDRQVEQIANSIREFGFLSPCVIDGDNNVIAGHGRLMAAKKLGMDKVPCVLVDGLTEEERRAYILADNKLFDLGGWNEVAVDSEVEAIDLDLQDFGVGEKVTEKPESDVVRCPRCGHAVEV